MERFAGKVAIVTGGASGIGAATVSRLILEGGNVLVADRQEPARLAASASFVKTDVTDASDVEAMVSAALDCWGRLDVLINNAGTGALGSTSDCPPEDWDRVFAVNSTAIYRCCRAAIPHIARTRGSIVNVASISGLGGDYAMAAYNASKGAIVNYTRSLAVDCAAQGIRVNAICPGLVATPMSAAGLADTIDRDHWFERIPLGRAAEPEEMASVIAFLASEDASYVTGAILAADGGATAHTGQPDFPARRRARAQRNA